MQGLRSHQKTDRMLGIALKNKLPVVLFAEGGGGRPGDTDLTLVAGLHVSTFASYARLSRQVPVVGVVAGRCFAGNAALLGCSDVIIAARGSNIGMGGPAMVEGADRDALYQQLPAKQYDNGGAINMAATLEIDAVMDSALMRDWLARGLQSAGQASSAAGVSRRFIDTW